MLRQILRDMWVDPELLAELDDEQRLALFCRMRAEQVRRWAEREKSAPPLKPRLPPKPGTPAPKGAKRVDWLLGADGEPWVWVMGEHPDDLPLKHMEQHMELPMETSQPADTNATHQDTAGHVTECIRENATCVTAQPLEQRMHEDFDLQNKQEILPHQKADGVEQYSSQGEESIYCTVDELRAVAAAAAAAAGEGTPVAERRGALLEISLNTPAERQEKVSQRVALWERRVAEERGGAGGGGGGGGGGGNAGAPRVPRRHPDQPQQPHPQQLPTLRNGSDDQQEEIAWREQERRAKEAEQQIREIARRAREEHRRTSVLAMEVEAPAPPAPDPSLSVNSNLGLTTYTAKPPSAEAVVEWFRSSEVARRAGLAPGSNLVAPWFHGLITRQEAEKRLDLNPEGSFLVRVSERVWGYAISYKAPERCKHFLIDASSGQYQFLGAHQNTHSSLGDLVEYHAKQPITVLGNERLLHPCVHTEVPSIFHGILTPNVSQ